MELIDDNILLEGPYGLFKPDFQYWDDYMEFQEEILKYKIIKIKIYYNSKEKDKVDKQSIIGISLTYRNYITGEIREIEHKGTDETTGMKELLIKPGEYLKKFHINFKDDFDGISRIGFITSKKNELYVGLNDGKEKYISLNDEDAIIVSTFGYFKEKIYAFGCCFVKRKLLSLKTSLFGFFLLRNYVKKNEDFKKKWDDKYKILNFEYRYIWRIINLPDDIFTKIMKKLIVY